MQGYFLNANRGITIHNPVIIGDASSFQSSFVLYDAGVTLDQSEAGAHDMESNLVDEGISDSD